MSRQIRVPLTPWQQVAPIDFAYNLGEEALARLFNAGQVQARCEQLPRWVKARAWVDLAQSRVAMDRTRDAGQRLQREHAG